MADSSPPTNYSQNIKDLFQFEQIEKNLFRTRNLWCTRQPSTKVAHGGILVSLSLAAAEKTIPHNHKPHAIHSFFILAAYEDNIITVDTEQPADFKVENLGDNKSFSKRNIQVIQNGKIRYVMQASFQKPEKDSNVHQIKMPKVKDWKDLRSFTQLVPELIKNIELGSVIVTPAVNSMIFDYDIRCHTEQDLFEVRPVDPNQYFGLTDMSEKTEWKHYYWFRAKGDLSNLSDDIHRYLIIYNMDATMCRSIICPHYRYGFYPTIIASLDHNVWIHHYNISSDQWLLFENWSPISTGSRGLSIGRVWTSDGKLVMTCTQEVLLRTKGPISRL